MDSEEVSMDSEEVSMDSEDSKAKKNPQCFEMLLWYI